MQTKNIYLQIANKLLSQPKINLLCVFGRIERIRVLSLKQTESDKTNTLDIFLFHLFCQ